MNDIEQKIDLIVERERDAAVDAYMSDAADEFWEDKELLHQITADFAELVALSKKLSGVYCFHHYHSLGAEIRLDENCFSRLFSNNPDVVETDKPSDRCLERTIEMNGVTICCRIPVKYELVRVQECA